MKAGENYYRLTAIREIKGRQWEFSCQCGAIHIASKHDVARGFVKSCGCLKREVTTAKNKANCSRDGMTHTYTGQSWQGMMNRCFRTNYRDYQFYGAVGITACEALQKSPMALVRLIGERPNRLTLDRIDGTKGYYCGQCDQCNRNSWPLNIRWATYAKQSRNLRTNHYIEINGVSKCVADWCDSSKLPESTIRDRIKRGVTGIALLAPRKFEFEFTGRRMIDIDGDVKSLSQWSRERDISPSTIHNRLKRGWSGQKLLTKLPE